MAGERHGEREDVAWERTVSRIRELLETIQADMLRKAKEKRDENIVECLESVR